VVDKTGTLTAGAPAVAALVPAGHLDENALLRVVAALEQASEHPLASAVVAAAKARGLALPPVTHFESITGRGVVGEVEGRQVIAGGSHLLSERGVDTSALDAHAASLRRQGQTVVYVSMDGRADGVLGIADPIKPSTPEALDSLRRDGLRVMMVTGDNRATAEAVAATLGIAASDVRAELLPADKRDVILQLQSEGRIVAMAGDGINDAPALAAAAVGIAMGTGTDVAIESAGITLVKGDLRGIVRARRLSRATMRNVRQNLFLAFVYNAVGVPIAAGVLYPFTGVLIGPIWASAAMTFSSVSVILNALRLRRAEL
jgi:Cu+-exporting ATPase